MTSPALAPRRASTKAAARLAACIPDGIVRHEVTDRAAWLRMREQDVTASAIAALVGEHPYMTKLGLYALKTGQMPDVSAEPVIGENSISLPPMLRGTVLEPVAPALITMLRPTWSVEPCGWYYRDPAARIGATPDFIAIDPERPGVRLRQVKTTDHTTFRKVWRVDGDDGDEITPPLFIAIQAVVEAVLAGFSWAQVAVMVSGSTLDLHLVEIPLHLGLMARLREESLAFWRLVAAGTPPEADYGRDAEVLAALYREDNGQQLDLTAEERWPALLEERDGLKAAIRTASERVGAIDCEIKARLGNYESARFAGRRVTWALQQRRHRFVPPSEGRTLRFFASR